MLKKLKLIDAISGLMCLVMLSCNPETKQNSQATPVSDSTFCLGDTAFLESSCARDMKVIKDSSCTADWRATWNVYSPAFGIRHDVKNPRIDIPADSVKKFLNFCKAPQCDAVQVFWGLRETDDDTCMALVMSQLSTNSCGIYHNGDGQVVLLSAYTDATNQTHVSFIDADAADALIANWKAKFPLIDPETAKPYTGKDSVLYESSYSHPTALLSMLLAERSATVLRFVPAMHEVDFQYETGFNWPDNAAPNQQAMVPIFLLTNNAIFRRQYYDIARPCPKMCSFETFGAQKIP